MTQCCEESIPRLPRGSARLFRPPKKRSQEERWPTTWGSSSGRWDGDTLIIETLSVRHPAPTFRYRLRLPDELAVARAERVDLAAARHLAARETRDDHAVVIERRARDREPTLPGLGRNGPDQLARALIERDEPRVASAAPTTTILNEVTQPPGGRCIRMAPAARVTERSRREQSFPLEARDLVEKTLRPSEARARHGRLDPAAPLRVLRLDPEMAEVPQRARDPNATND
jgi:hypothetical protein